MSENILLLAAFNRDKNSYREMLNTVPEGVSIHVVPYNAYERNGIVTGDTIRATLLEYMHARNISAAHLVGHSLGGLIAMDFASREPGKVRSLTLVDSAGIPQRRSALVLGSAITCIVQFPLQKLQDNILIPIRMIRHPLISLKTFSHVAGADVRELVKSLRVPTLIMWGEKDLVTPVTSGQELYREIKGSQMEILPQLDHDWIMHEPKIFWRRYASFLHSQK